jgi:hypothetical protein
MMEKIPPFIMQGKTKVMLKDADGNIIKNLPENADGETMSATFESPRDVGLIVFLKPKDGVRDPITGFFESVPDSEMRIVFKGGKWRTDNKELMLLLMANSEYKRKFTIDSEDPTGLWRAYGAIEVEMRPVIARAHIIAPDANDIKDLNPKKVPEGKVEPIRVIG